MSHAQNQAAGNFLVPNATFIVELILFLVILAVLGRVVLPRIQGAMSERRRMVDQQLRDSEEAKDRLAAAQRAYQDALVEARTEAAQIREDARAESQREIDARRSAAQQEYDRIVARGTEQLTSQRAAIVRELRAEIGTLAVQLSEKIVDQPLAQDAEVSSTVDSFLAGLAAEDTARSGAQT